MRPQRLPYSRNGALDFAVCGRTTDDLRFRVLHGGKEVANLPIKELGDEAPEYDRPWTEPNVEPVLPPEAFPLADDYGEALLWLLGSSELSSRRWVFEQYDTLIGGDVVRGPARGSGIVRVGEEKALAFTSDVTPRYVAADPYEGGKQAVAEAFRNLSAVGAEPIAATDNLNFGNPEKPEIMGQLVAAIRGIGEACGALDMPIVSGNVSLYNETDGRAIKPTPTIGAVGLIADRTKVAGPDGMASDDVVFLVGTEGTHLGRSLYQWQVCQEERGAPPPVDLPTPKHGAAASCVAPSRPATPSPRTTCRTGGLAVALAEMCPGLGHRHEGRYGPRALRPRPLSSARIRAATSSRCARSGPPCSPRTRKPRARASGVSAVWAVIAS